MATATLYLNGKVIWCAELGRSKTDKPMRGVLVALSNDPDDERPPCFVRLFGEDAEAVKAGDTLAAEGELEASLGERDGKPNVRLSIMAKWSRLTGHAGARRRRGRNRDDDRQPSAQPAPSGPPGPEPLFDDELSL